MKTSSIVLVVSLIALVGFMWTSIGSLEAGDPAGDTSEGDGCAACHYNPAQADINNEWKASGHGSGYSSRVGNDYCARCHAPFQADPDATYGTKQPVAIEDWQGITCGACHPDHNDRVAWGTPIGNYNVAEGEHFPVYDVDELCEYCHEGRHGGKDFQGYGKIMAKKDIECIDCHMGETDNTLNEGTHMSHDFHVDGEISCGVNDADCHINKDIDWAQKQIDKEKIHQKDNHGKTK